MINNAGEVFEVIDDYFAKYTKNTEYIKTWLVRQLLGLIEADNSIGRNKFVINPKSVQSYKEDVLAQKEINFYYFIAGIWLYVYRYNKDISLGKDAILSWDNKEEKNDLLDIGDRFDNIKINFDKTVVDSVELDFATNEENASKYVFVNTDDVVPDLAELVPENIIFASEGIIEEESPYTKYLKAIRKKHYMLNTFVYENERKLDSFYVCNDLHLQEGQPLSLPTYYDCSEIKNVTIEKFPFKKYPGVLISADGGMGKSMMLHHLIVDMVDRFPEVKLVPIFVTARLYNPERVDLMDLIFTEFQRHNSDFSLADITALFAAGCAIVLIDGLDEISSNHINTFMDEFDRFKDCYPKVRFVFSTRKHINSSVLSGFCKFNLMPFDIEQALLMVKKLDSNVIKESTKESFIEALLNGTNGLNWEEQHEFLGNPLLLTIMLLAYEENFEIPTQRYLFYENAYNALAKKHDATKGLVREFKTGLSIKDFQLYFGEFCAATYGEEKYEFKEKEFYEKISDVIKANQLNVSEEDFIADIIEKLCLMYKDGEEYHFIHRSFQEYFTAYFFSKQDARYYKPIYEMFMAYDECRHEDQVLSMLYGMAPQSMELHIIIPFLKELTEGEYSGYGYFLDRLYPCLYFEDGECSQHFLLDDSESAIYNFIKKHYKIEQNSQFKAIADMGCIRPLLTFLRVPKCWLDGGQSDELVVVERDDVDSEYFAAYDYDEEIVGYMYEAPIMDLTRDVERNRVLLEHIFSDDFSLKIEYDLAVELLKKLERKYEEKPIGERKSFISKFH